MSNTYSINRTKWAMMTIFEQMGNIYSEVGRSFAATQRHNDTERDLAAGRAIDLFDATIETLINEKSHRSKEVLRAKEQFLESIYGDTASDASRLSLDTYFLQFAIAARLNR